MSVAKCVSIRNTVVNCPSEVDAAAPVLAKFSHIDRVILDNCLLKHKNSLATIETGIGATGPAVIEWSLPDEATESIVVENNDFYWSNTTGTGKAISTNSGGNLLTSGILIYLNNRLHQIGTQAPLTANNAPRRVLASTRDRSGRSLEWDANPGTDGTIGTVIWQRGDTVWYTLAALGQPPAWIATQDGTGAGATWKAIPNLV